MKIFKGLYQHYKGAFYKVLDVARHSETEEALVIYQALYGEKGTWARPLSMFTETVTRDGQTRPRFNYLNEQTEVLEVARLDIKPERQQEFEIAFEKAQVLIAGTAGYLSHDLQRCLEVPNRYILLVGWQRLEDHTDGFRNSSDYSEWTKLLHHFYDPFPVVEHYKALSQS